jgi:hypothetical protein
MIPMPGLVLPECIIWMETLREETQFQWCLLRLFAALERSVCLLPPTGLHLSVRLKCDRPDKRFLWAVTSLDKNIFSRHHPAGHNWKWNICARIWSPSGLPSLESSLNDIAPWFISVRPAFSLIVVQGICSDRPRIDQITSPRAWRRISSWRPRERQRGQTQIGGNCFPFRMRMCGFSIWTLFNSGNERRRFWRCAGALGQYFSQHYDPPSMIRTLLVRKTSPWPTWIQLLLREHGIHIKVDFSLGYNATFIDYWQINNTDQKIETRQTVISAKRWENSSNWTIYQTISWATQALKLFSSIIYRIWHYSVRFRWKDGLARLFIIWSSRETMQNRLPYA